MRLRDPRLLLLVSAAMLGAAIAFPLGVIASHQFTDVPNSNTFHADIDAIADAGVTTGCAAGKYCPKDFVTREQMAAFLNRLGALQAGKTPVVNATKLDGRDSSDFLGVGDIVMVQYGPWMLYTPTGARIQPSGDAAYVVPESPGATHTVAMSLQAPASVDGRTFGLKSVQVCFGQSNASLDNFYVRQATTSGYVDLVVDSNAVPMSSNGCHTLTDPAPNTVQGGVTVTAQIYFNGADAVALKYTSATWTPTTLAP